MSAEVTLNEDTFEKLGTSQDANREIGRNLESIGKEILTALPGSISEDDIELGVSRVSGRASSDPRNHMWLMFSPKSDRGTPQLPHSEILVAEDNEGPYAVIRFNALQRCAKNERDRIAQRLQQRPKRFLDYLNRLDDYTIRYKASYQRNDVTKGTSELAEKELISLGKTGITDLNVYRKYRPEEGIFTRDFVELSKNLFQEVFFPLLADFTFEEPISDEGEEWVALEYADIEEIIEDLENDDRSLRKIVAHSPTNYVYSYQNGVWAFRESEFYLGKHEEMEKGDVILFELTTEDDGPEENIFIGFGIASVGYRKDDPWFHDEIEQNENLYPLVVEFSDTYWLGAVDQIALKPFTEKDDEQLTQEESFIASTGPSRQDIIDELGYHIPQMNFESVKQHKGDILRIINESGTLIHRKHDEPKKSEEKNVEESYFILKTGDEEYQDIPAEQYHFKKDIPGSAQIRDCDQARFVYLENDEFYGIGTIEEFEEEERDGKIHYFGKVENYEEIDPIPFENVRSAISPDFPIQYGIIHITEEDYKIITGSQSDSIRLENIPDSFTRPEIYREAVSHLVAGKSVIFYGAPGTGKTRAANILSENICHETKIVTANAEWSNYDVIGGYQPKGGSWVPKQGFLTEMSSRCGDSINGEGTPSWIIIDELNRANLDEAFGEVFTLLDIDYRSEENLEYADTEVEMPLSFRILATMNTYDRAQLFSLGYAFMRRFAFIEIPSLLRSTSSSSPSEGRVPEWDPETWSETKEIVIEPVQELGGPVELH